MSKTMSEDFGLRTLSEIEDEERENTPLTLGQRISIFLTGTGSQPSNYTLGTDVSHWQGYVNWVTMREKGMKFGITKATDFYKLSPIGFVDSKAEQNYKGMVDNGILTGGYCWLQPKQDPKHQAAFYLDNFYLKHDLDFPPILDFEDRSYFSASDFLWRAQVWLDIVEKATGRIPIVYTSSGFMMNFDSSKTGFLARYPLWTAQYIQRTYPSLYKPFSKWTMWQFSDRGHYPFYIYGDKNYYGKSWGVTSGYLDMNYYNGDYATLLDDLQTSGGSVTPPEPPDEDEILFMAKCVATSILNVRSGAGTNYPIVGYLSNGTVRNVYEISGGWYRIGNNEWVSSSYMQRTDEPIPDFLFKAKCIVNALNVRGGAGTSYPIVKQITLNTIVNVYEVSSSNWFKISKDSQEWVSGSTSYMIRV